MMSQNIKTTTFFHSGGHKTNFKDLFWMLTLGHICCYFAFVLVFITLMGGEQKQRCQKNTSFVSSGFGVLCPPESKKKS